MEKKIVRFPSPEQRPCPSCGHQGATLSFEKDEFEYGAGKEKVTLSARVPILTCPECEERFYGEDAETIRHAEICRHLGRLSPAELKEIREGYHLSQEEWADRIKVGLASIKRWEAGNLIQTEGYDRYLRLLRYPENLARVERDEQSHDDARPKFQTVLPESAYRQAAIFVLRRNHRY